MRLCSSSYSKSLARNLSAEYILNTEYYFKRKLFGCFHSCYGSFCTENSRKIKNCSSRFNVGDFWFTIQISRACASLSRYIRHFFVRHLGNNANSLENKAPFSNGWAGLAALNLMKLVSYFNLTIFRLVLCTFCFVAVVKKLFFLKGSEEFLVHVIKDE